MADYWIGDAAGRILGPLGLQVLSDLVSAGRLTGIARASRDGRTWAPVKEFPELVSLLAAGDKDAGERSLQQAARVRAYLEEIRNQPTHQILRVEREASLDAYRAAFFGLVKRFYPDLLPHGTDPALRKACEDTFLFLANRMVQVEREIMARTPAVTPPGSTAPPMLAPARPATPSPALKPAASPTYQPDEFLGLERRKDERIVAKLRITSQHAGIFTSHPLLNISTGGLFIPGSQTVPVGTPLDVEILFIESKKEIKARGTVAWANAGGDTRQPLGFGVRFTMLSAQDKEYIQRFVAAAGPRRTP